MSALHDLLVAQFVALGYDLDDPHLSGSPGRIARFWSEWHTVGRPPPKLTTFPAEHYDQIVVVDGIRFYALCAHHGLPFHGDAAVGYLPGARLVGLSKFARVVDHYARRFTTQERMTEEIADHLSAGLEPRGLGVVVRAEHLCMSMRGIQRPGHSTVTSAMRGVFLDKPEARAELLALVGR